MKVFQLLILSFSLTPLLSLSQTDSVRLFNTMSYGYHMKKDLAIITGFQIQENQFAELGFGVIDDGILAHHPFAFGYGVSNEIKISNEPTWGLKAGAWVNGGQSIELHLVSYTDFEEMTPRFRPEIGVGVSVFRLVYGYNFPLFNKGFIGVNNHNFGLSIMLKVKTLKESPRN